MWNYEKRLQYPVNITTPNAKLAQFIMSQFGGPDGEIGASIPAFYHAEQNFYGSTE